MTFINCVKQRWFPTANRGHFPKYNLKTKQINIESIPEITKSDYKDYTAWSTQNFPLRTSQIMLSG